MSWFRRRPKIKEAPKEKPHHISPMAEKHLKEVKEKTKPSESDSIKSSSKQ